MNLFIELLFLKLDATLGFKEKLPLLKKSKKNS